MSEFDVIDGAGCSSNNKRWHWLLHVAQLLSEGKNELKNEIQEQPHTALSDALFLDFKKGKRSPRKKRVVYSPCQSLNCTSRTGKTIRLRIIFDANDLEEIVPDVICSVSKKITIKKPCLKNPDKNPRKRRMNSEEDDGASKKRAKKSSVVMDPAADLPEVFKNRILETGGDLESLLLVIQKELTKTDLSTGHGRLSVPYKKVRNEFLKPSEVEQSNTEKGGIKTALIQPCLEECKISLRNWRSNSEYVLVRDWNMVCNRNGLKEGMKIRLWSFRRNSDLYFALVQLS